MKFKVGDKVRVLESKSKLFGKEGVITTVKVSSLYPYAVEGESAWSVFVEEDLELIEEPKGKTLEQIKKDYSYPVKDIRLDKLKQLIKAVNTLGEFGKQVELKITIELDGNKIEL